MIQIAICEDNPIHLTSLSRMVESLDSEECFQILRFSTADALCAALSNGGALPQILLCDVMLENGKNGIQMVKALREAHPEMAVIFVSGHPEYVFHAYEVRHTYYLTKPIGRDILAKAICRALEDTRDFSAQYLWVHSKGKAVRLHRANILYVESELRALKIHTREQTYRAYLKLDALEEALDRRFLRCHKSYILNLDWVKAYEKTAFLLQDSLLIEWQFSIRKN